MSPGVFQTTLPLPTRRKDEMFSTSVCWCLFFVQWHQKADIASGTLWEWSVGQQWCSVMSLRLFFSLFFFFLFLSWQQLAACRITGTMCRFSLLQTWRLADGGEPQLFRSVAIVVFTRQEVIIRPVSSCMPWGLIWGYCELLLESEETGQGKLISMLTSFGWCIFLFLLFFFKRWYFQVQADGCVKPISCGLW